MIIAGFVIAAAAGTVARWQLATHLPAPTGTLVANLTGSFALGLLAGAGNAADTVVGVAGLGALTTFSTLMVELLDLWPARRGLALGYLVTTLAGGVALAWLGLRLG